MKSKLKEEGARFRESLNFFQITPISNSKLGNENQESASPPLLAQTKPFDLQFSPFKSPFQPTPNAQSLRQREQLWVERQLEASNDEITSLFVSKNQGQSTAITNQFKDVRSKTQKPNDKDQAYAEDLQSFLNPNIRLLKMVPVYDFLLQYFEGKGKEQIQAKLEHQYEIDIVKMVLNYLKVSREAVERFGLSTQEMAAKDFKANRKYKK